MKTAENFGIQGEPPSHPELLDWLASELVRTGLGPEGPAPADCHERDLPPASQASPPSWHATRKTACSLAGRDSACRPRWSATTPWRSPACWSSRSAARRSSPISRPASGKSSPAGRARRPYVQDKGPGLYRRSLYVYRKRTVPHPLMATFDAPSREICQVKRPRTNTPLQALELLNDVTYVEAARQLAQRSIESGGTDDRDRLVYAFRRARPLALDAPSSNSCSAASKRYQAHFAPTPPPPNN